MKIILAFSKILILPLVFCSCKKEAEMKQLEPKVVVQGQILPFSDSILTDKSGVKVTFSGKNFSRSAVTDSLGNFIVNDLYSSTTLPMKKKDLKNSPKRV